MAGDLMCRLIHRLVCNLPYQQNYCCMYAWRHSRTHQLLQCYMLATLDGSPYPPGIKHPGVPAW